MWVLRMNHVTLLDYKPILGHQDKLGYYELDKE